MTTILCVPQWQGSAAEQAPLLADGARRTAELLGARPVVTVPTADRGGTQITEGIRARAALVHNLERTADALAGIDDFVLTVGGDCAVDIAPIVAARQRYGEALRVLWVDAHPDVYGPGELPSGAFHGMVVRTLLGDGPAALTLLPTLDRDQVILTGVRAGGASEQAYLRETGLRRHGVEDWEQAFDGLTGPTYVHVDLDVLDPAEFGSVCYPEPDGIRSSRLIDRIARLDNIVGAAITEHAPAGNNPSEAAIIERLGAALAR